MVFKFFILFCVLFFIFIVGAVFYRMHSNDGAYLDKPVHINLSYLNCFKFLFWGVVVGALFGISDYYWERSPQSAVMWFVVIFAVFFIGFIKCLVTTRRDRISESS